MGSVYYEVNVEDQEKIVNFSLLYNRKLRLQQKLELLKQEQTYLSDAQEECMIALETPLFKIGDCFLKLEDTQLEEELNKRKDLLEAQLNKLTDELQQTETESNALKSYLYSKFGNRINLEA
ncbi:hypothetical protein MACK_002524 [Theileria orientalis]|uniref:Prefoldin subunit 4 n=1 Tax=Theileria orientalis TaxID=68886 RepID=A0A976MEV2_THEOR|nr:hypothetical protein MACK_002524 [Theileria orientalis]